MCVYNDDTVCGGYVYAGRGVIPSPNYPNSYPDNSNCTWTIRCQPGRTLQLNFTAFSVRGVSGSCTDDYVEVIMRVYFTVACHNASQIQMCCRLQERFGRVAILYSNTLPATNF